MEASRVPAERACKRVTGLLVDRAAPRAGVSRAARSTGVEHAHPGPLPDFARRGLNVAAAAGLLVVASPLMLVIALATKLTSSGPILFTQERVGLNRRNGGRPVASCQGRSDCGGKPLTIFKFRTMGVNGTNGDRQVWAEPDDPRVTPLGRLLRKYRLDELPQLVNVLRGDMNLVGPRPEQPEIFAHMREQIERYEERQRVRPGITGWAQVNHHYDLSVEDVRRKIELDLEYVQRQSVREDLKIMLRTVPVVVFKQGAW